MCAGARCGACLSAYIRACVRACARVHARTRACASARACVRACARACREPVCPVRPCMHASVLCVHRCMRVCVTSSRASSASNTYHPHFVLGALASFVFAHARTCVHAQGRADRWASRACVHACVRACVHQSLPVEDECQVVGAIADAFLLQAVHGNDSAGHHRQHLHRRLDGSSNRTLDGILNATPDRTCMPHDSWST